MLLSFLDESNQAPVTSFAGVVVTASQVVSLGAGLRQLGQRIATDYGFSRPPVFHAYEMFHGVGSWKLLPPRVRVRMCTHVLRLVAEHATAIVWQAVDTTSWAGRMHGLRGPGISADAQCLDLTLTRLNGVARRHNTHTLVIADMRTDRDSHQARFEMSQQPQSPTFDRVLDTIHFAPSRRSALLQGADVVAFTLRRRLAGERDERSASALRVHVDVLTGSGKLTEYLD